MAWVEDTAAAQFPLATVVKQQGTLPTSNLFTTLPENRVLRVFQLCALQTQEELVDILRSSLFGIFELEGLQTYRYAYQDELIFLLDAILYYGSTWKRAQSIGDRMQNLVLRDEAKALEMGMTSVVRLDSSLAPTRARLILHALLTVCIPYMIRKVQRKSLEEDWERDNPRSLKAKLAKFIRLLSIIWSILSLINTLHFLATAQYRTLVERLLSLRLVYGAQKTQRFSNLMYLNQHVTWKTWSSFLALVNVGRYISRLTRSLQAFTAPSANLVPNDTVCCACHDRPTIGQRSNCGHVYCYYCIKSRLLDAKMAGSFRCLHCGSTVHQAFPLK
ncbi:Pex [Trypanosoma melophagium]|uniref:Pex n=1 Tax=Trypanosoma melophagium TaxID=715481 RepID=UPI003519FDA2|nr:Pex [Trypanosoma melophagium]